MAELRLCSVDGCGKRHQARGLCKLHYTRYSRSKGLPPKLRRSVTMDWIHENLSFDRDECLSWPFAKNTYGYGILKVSSKCTSASRYTCLLAHGSPPTPDHEAAHSCGNRSCVNHRHLRWATPLENCADKTLHGTTNAKITDEDIQEIRRLRGTTSIRKLGECFNLHHTTISQIQRGLRRTATTSEER